MGRETQVGEARTQSKPHNGPQTRPRHLQNPRRGWGGESLKKYATETKHTPHGNQHQNTGTQFKAYNKGSKVTTSL